MKVWAKRSLVLASLLAACGAGSSGTAASDPSSPRPVRVEATETTSPSDEAAHPVRVAPSIPGEAAESDDLADPPPVEAPTAP